MSGSGICNQELDSRAGMVAGVENRARLMFNGEIQRDQSWLEHVSRTVFTVYIPSVLGREYFEMGKLDKAVEFLKLAANREKNPLEKRKLLNEIEEARAKL